MARQYTPAQRAAYGRAMSAQRTYATRAPRAYSARPSYRSPGYYAKKKRYVAKRGPNAPKYRSAKKYSAEEKAYYYANRARGFAESVDGQTNGEIGAVLGGAAGAFLGGPAGASLGTFLGRGAHKMLKSITGFGDYRVNSNSLMTGGMSPPQIINSTNKGGFIVRHREYLGDITATTDFTINAYSINPGLKSTFPWLAQIADSFEQYRMRGLVFEFKSMSSDSILSSATSTALGVVVMATEYNVLDGNFQSKSIMENYDFANSGKPSQTLYHPVECAQRMGNPLANMWTRSSPVPSTADARMYDLGLFQLATSGMQAAGGTIGELWATYEVELYKAKVGTNGSLCALFTDFTGLSGSTPLGTARTTNSGNTLDASINGLVVSLGAKAAGNSFMFEWTYAGSSAGSLTMPSFTLDGCTANAIFSDSSSAIQTPNAASTTQAIYTIAITVQSEEATITLSTATLNMSSNLTANVIISQISPAL